MKLSVIIPAFNHLSKVLACLYSLRVHAEDQAQIEYLVQDDASQEYDGPSVIQPGLASVERNESNLGFAGNAKRGAARAVGEILFFVNQDAYAVWGWSDAWDQAIVEAFRDRKVGVVGARLLFPSGRVQSAGGGFNAKAQPYHRGLGNRDLEDLEVGTAHEVGWTTGAALATRRELWETIGGFDAAYGRGYFEDVDYCLRVRELGFQTWYQPECTLFHTVFSTGGSNHVVENAILFRARWKDKIILDGEPTSAPHGAPHAETVKS